MDISKIRQHFGDNTKECEKCAHDFLKFEYEILFKLISELESKKLLCQKFFVTLVTTVAALAIAFLNFWRNSNPNTNYPTETLIGILLIFCSMIGFVIIRNLASIRKFEVYYANTIKEIRLIFLDVFDLKEILKSFKISKVTDRNSSDYITLLFGNMLNLFFCSSGIFFLTKNIENNKTVIPVIVIGTITFLIAHYVIIERYLRKPMAATAG